MLDVKEGSQRIKTYTIVILGQKHRFVTYGFYTFNFCEELWPKLNYRVLWGPYKARVQNGISGSYMDAIFELVVHEKPEIWASLPYSFIKEGLLQLPGK